MRINNSGQGSGLLLVSLLIVSLIVAYLSVKQMGAFGYGTPEKAQEQQEETVKQAQDMVDSLNERMMQNMGAGEQ